MPKYKIKLSNVGNFEQKLYLEGTIEASSKSELQYIILKICTPFLEHEYDDHVMLREVPEDNLKHETYGVCVGSSDDWDCCGLFEIIEER